MPKPTPYLYQVHLNITDTTQLFEAAVRSCQRARMAPADIEEFLRPNGTLAIEACLRQLLDPGQSPPGCEILDTSAAEG